MKSFTRTTAFGIFDILAILFKTELQISKPVRNFKEVNIINDTFFELQNFKHSFTFEFV